MCVKRKFNYGTFVGLTILHLVAGYAIWRGIAHGYSVVAWITFFVFWVVIALFGTSLGSHRYFTHSTFRCKRPLQYIMAGLHGMAIQGPLTTWLINHFFHHVFEDTPGKDPHTPFEYSGGHSGIKKIYWAIRGFYWSHVGWTYHDVVIPDKDRYKKKISDLSNHPAVIWEKKWHMLFFVFSFLLPFLIAGWDGLWLAGVLRIVLYLHATWMVNSVCHRFGTRLTGESRNNIVVAVVTLGEGFHATHHKFPNSAEFALHWYDFEPGTWVVRILESLNVVSNVGRPTTSTD